MRFIVRNVARGASSRVSLGGKPLPPGSTRVLLGLTDALAKELHVHMTDGVIEVACGGKYLSPDFFVAAKAAEVAVSAPEVVEVAAEVVAPTEEVSVAVEETDVSAPPAHTAESLGGLRVADLRSILDAIQAGASAGKTKAQLIEAILATQGA